MDNIKIGNEEIKLKKSYLSNVEVNMMVKEVLEVYSERGDFEKYNYSPLAMLTNFYALLFDFCIDGYDISSTDDYNKYYNLGVHHYLLDTITNADEAYDLMMEMSDKFSGINNIIEKVVYNFLEKIPDIESLEDIVDKLPKQWQETVAEYNSIIGKTNNEEDA